MIAPKLAEVGTAASQNIACVIGLYILYRYFTFTIYINFMIISVNFLQISL